MWRPLLSLTRAAAGMGAGVDGGRSLRRQVWRAGMKGGGLDGVRDGFAELGTRPPSSPVPRLPAGGPCLNIP